MRAPASAALAAALLAAGCAGPAADRAARAPAAAPTANVLVYLVDTLRADHLGCYGYPRPVSPAIDALAAEATLFENAVAVSSWTRPTVATLLTGLSPFAHGVRTLTDGLPDEVETLPEVLRPAGYATAAFSSNWHVSPATGFGQGFDHFAFQPDDPGSEALTRRVLAWLDGRPAGKPWLIYAHALDPHAPYRPPEDLRRILAPASTRPEAGSREDLLEVFKLRRRDRVDRVAELRDLYDAELADTDRHFGQLLDGLRSRGVYRDTMVILVADHGEGFDEHARLGHGNTLYGELLNVPLIVKPPGERPARRVRELASQTDLLPTVLAALGLPVPTGAGGRDLLAPAAATPRPVAADLDYERLRGLALVDQDWKYIEPRSRRFGRAPQLFSRSRDPLDRDDVAAAHPERVAEMARLLAAELRRAPPRRAPVRPDAEGERALRALGYL